MNVIAVVVFTAVFAFAVVVVEAIVANANFGTVVTAYAVHGVIVAALAAMPAPFVIVVAAVIAYHNLVVVLIVSVVHVTLVMKFAALGAFAAIFFEAVRAYVGTVYASHVTARIVFVAMAAKQITVFKANVANVDMFAVFVDDVSGAVTAASAFVASFAISGIAIFAVKVFGNFFTATNAKPIDADSKSFEVVKVIVVNGNRRSKVGERPILVTAEAVAGIDVNVAAVIEVSLAVPSVGHFFEQGNFTLNDVKVKL